MFKKKNVKKFKVFSHYALEKN